MLRPINEIELSVTERQQAADRGVLALDLDTGSWVEVMGPSGFYIGEPDIWYRLCVPLWSTPPMTPGEVLDYFGYLYAPRLEATEKSAALEEAWQRLVDRFGGETDE